MGKGSGRSASGWNSSIRLWLTRTADTTIVGNGKTVYRTSTPARFGGSWQYAAAGGFGGLAGLIAEGMG